MLAGPSSTTGIERAALELPILTPHHCYECDDIRPHHPESLTCLYCESIIPSSYFPYESSGKVEVDLRRRRCWAFLQCDPEIVLYYSWFLEREGFNLRPNVSNPHISFIRDEEPYLWDDFLKLDGKPGIRFKYSNNVRTNGFHYWVDVQCKELFEIRRGLGLADDKRLSLHMTIGRRYRPDDRPKLEEVADEVHTL